MKSWIKRSLVESGALRLAAKVAPRGVAIVMYHSVMDEPGSEASTLGGIIHSTRDFRQQMEVVARHFSPVTMHDVLQFVRGDKDLPPRPVVITFDDGYADNYQVASPILKRVGVPAAFYVTVECVEKRKLPWPARARHAFLTSKKMEWTEPQGERWPLSSPDQRSRAFERALQYCGKLAGDSLEDFVRTLEHELETAPRACGDSLMMTWDEVRGLAREGHIVGSHTMTHPNMAHVQEEDLKREFVQSKNVLERELAGQVVHFSYPCPVLQPHWAEHTVRASRESGYRTAVTTTGGLVRRNDNPLCLRRIRPTKDADGLRWNLESKFVNHGA
jgi:peptidoglycan/xylan/chitin deacetylase (PgdA/CDA1 family)